jgi:hypothetical protein
VNLALLDKFILTLYDNHSALHSLRKSQFYDVTNLFKSLENLEKDYDEREQKEKLVN